MTKHFNNLSEIEELINQFSTQKLPADQWTHEAHLSVALWYIKNYTIEEATCYLRSGIIIYNKAIGNENTGVKGYHETITLFWIKVIAEYLKKNQSDTVSDTINSFLSSSFSQRNYALNFYTKEVLLSNQARAYWTEPDHKNFNF